MHECKTTVARGDENRPGQCLFGSVSAQLRAASQVTAAGQPAHSRTAGRFKPVWTAQRAGWLGG